MFCYTWSRLMKKAQALSGARFKRSRRAECGAAICEYAIILMAVTLIAAPSLRWISHDINSTFLAAFQNSETSDDGALGESPAGTSDAPPPGEKGGRIEIDDI